LACEGELLRQYDTVRLRRERTVGKFAGKRDNLAQLRSMLVR
jgi:hypothetical protein